MYYKMRKCPFGIAQKNEKLSTLTRLNLKFQPNQGTSLKPPKYLKKYRLAKICKLASFKQTDFLTQVGIFSSFGTYFYGKGQELRDEG